MKTWVAVMSDKGAPSAQGTHGGLSWLAFHGVSLTIYLSPGTKTSSPRSRVTGTKGRY